MRIGLVIDSSIEHFRGALRGVAEFARTDKNWWLERYDATQRGLARLVASPCRGFLLGTVDRDVLGAAAALSLPGVSVGAPYPAPSLSTVTHDDIAIGELGGKYFLARQFQHFAYAARTGKQNDQRLLGFERALTERRHTCSVFDEDPDWQQNPQKRDDELGAWLWNLPKPVAVFCDCDERGWQVAEHCRPLEIAIPSQVALLGVDNDVTVCALTEPALSSIQTSSEQVGYLAAQRLAELLSDRSPAPRHVEVPPLRVIERRSTDTLIATDTVVVQAQRYMREKLREEHGVDTLCKALACSRRSLERRFQLATGMSPASMWTHFRVQEAQRLLMETDLTVELIADLCGFPDSRGLSGNFKRALGVTPTEYRRRARP